MFSQTNTKRVSFDIQKNDEKDYNDKISSANKKIEDDNFIKTIKEKFNAKSIENSVQIDDQIKGD